MPQLPENLAGCELPGAAGALDEEAIVERVTRRLLEDLKEKPPGSA